jgi:hypothetical protein
MPRICSSFRPPSWVFVIAVAAAGCQSTPVALTPAVGPGAAAAADLSPWLGEAREVTCTAYLQYIWVHSQRGSYLTWAVHPVLEYEAAEVDIRQCPEAARRLNDKEVMIRGRLIDCGEDHLPQLVAREIRPQPEAIALPIASRVRG